jgi:hypothetical protein
MKTHLNLFAEVFLLIAVLSALGVTVTPAHAQCGKLAMNPSTGKLDCVGPANYTQYTFATLPAVPAVGSPAVYCTDCAPATPCAAGGSGQVATSNGTAWTCGGAGVLKGAPAWLRHLGDGNEGAYTCTSGTCNLYGEHWYSSLSVSSGATLAVNGGNDLLILRVTGACTVAGTISGATDSQSAYFGGAGGGGGGGSSAGGAGGGATWNALAVAAGGTAGTAAAGGIGDSAFAEYGGPAASNTLLSAGSFWPLGGNHGGAGGNSGPAGGNGGSGLILVCGSINFTGTINASGVAGAPSTANNMGASGGGGGGYAILATPAYTANTGELNAAGAPGGNCYNPAIVLSVPSGISGATSGKGAIAHVSTFAAGNPTAVSVDAAGSAYNYTPSCTVTGTGGGANTGSAATCTVTMAGTSPAMTVASIAITGGNAGYGTGTAYTTCYAGGYGGAGWSAVLAIQ